MKRLIVFATIILSVIELNYSYSQLPNQNTYLLGQINNYTAYAGLWGYVSPSGSEYALLGCLNGTSIVDISDSSNIHEVDFIPGFNSVYREIKTYSHYAYIVSEATNSKLQILDLQYLPDSASLVTTFAYPGFTRAHNISQSGQFLYLSGGNVCPNGGVQILELSNPTTPIVRGFNSVRYVHDSRINNDTIWVANILNQRVSVINAINKDNLPEIRSFVSLEPMPHNIALSSDRKFLFLTHENQDPPGSLEIWNIEDLENITFVRNWIPTGITTSVIHNIEIFDSVAIIAHYSAGIRILNISDPVNPVEIAWYDTRPQDNDNIFQGCWGVYKFPSGKIIGSDISNGLFVIKTVNEILKPNLVYPLNNSIYNNLSVNFIWNKIYSPLWYVLIVSTDSIFNNVIIIDTLSTDTSKIINGLQRDTKYFWKVRAKDTSGLISNSAVWNFKTISPIKINLKLLMEGMYSSTFNLLTRNDTVEVFLRNSSPPYSLVDSAQSTIDSISFSGLFNFNNSFSGNYYIVVKHLNCIETWSKNGGELLNTDGTLYNYDFTTANLQAYGNNLKLKGSKYCVYSGDINQDGFITLFDVIPIYNNASNFLSGRYLVTDLTGDGIVDLADVTLCYNNSSNFIKVRRP